MATMMKAMELVVDGPPAKAGASTMKKVNATQTSIPKPTPTDNELLVKVQYSALDTVLDVMVVKNFVASMLHDMKHRPLIPGYHYVGTIEQVGASVVTTRDPYLRVGTVVYGFFPYSSKTKQGSLSEYITVDANHCAVMPSTILPQSAVAGGSEGSTALQSLRDLGGLKEGQSVLVIGAGGGVGGAAIGVAKSLGATVTVVCSTKDVERVTSLGPDHVIDRSKTDFNTMESNQYQYDVVFDTTAKYSMWSGTKWLKPKGTMVNTIPTIEAMTTGWFYSIFTGKKIRTVHVEPRKADLELLGQWMKNGTMKIDIDSEYKVSDFEAAGERHLQGSKNGRVVIQVEGGW
jgi:NADPH:quinone reductase-like Zn-dependent oxidoreductase